MHKEEIIKILATNNLAIQKSKGQNFLIDDDISRKIVTFIANQHNNIVEIGPGLGALTTFLAQTNKQITAIEIDKGLALYLKEKFPTVNIITSDFLKEKVPRETQVIISNVPYYITTKVIEKVLMTETLVKQFIFMIQKDVESRLFAKVRTKEYGPLSIFFTLFGNLKREMIVTKDKFYPVPNVDSAVFTCTFTDRNDVDYKVFYKFLKHVFLKRRKYLLSNLAADYERATLINIFQELALSEKSRIEELSPETILMLYLKLGANK